MCGIAGFVGGDWAGAGRAKERLSAMTRSIRHRGPDGTSGWVDPESKVALGQNRLAILDLSSAGDQPMPSPSGRYTIIYNGETYNHLELRKELEASSPVFWRGHSDTETLLAAIERWGISGALQRTVGMFAFALWDHQKKELTLARDRLGEKPLYYGWQGKGGSRTFLFASELKGLTSHPAFERRIDRQALSLYFRHAYVPAPYSIYQGIKKLPPGCFLTIGSSEADPAIETYWSAEEVAAKGVADPVRGSPEEVIEELHSVLGDAVKHQMLSDVPLGAFLSGGIDSSTVVALMQAQSARPVKTFSIGFHEQGYNEAEHAKAVARHLGTDHTEQYVSAEEARAVIPDLPEMYDEPFADSSQIPTFLVSKLARGHVTVALSGDGGDELFAGYNRYSMTNAFWRRLFRIPRPVRSAVSKLLTVVPPHAMNGLVSRLSPVLPSSLRMAVPGDKIAKAAGVLPSRSADELYLSLVSQWRQPSDLVIGGSEPGTLLTDHRPDLPGLSEIPRMMALDMMTYMPDDILVKVDRAAMRNSLETRVPFLDHRVVEFAWRMPMDLKLRDGQTKWALRQVLYRHVPKDLIERPKMGFGIPIDSWLRGPLKEWAEGLIDERRLLREGYLNPAPIRRAWAEHQSGRANLQHQLWTVLMFQSWLEQNDTATRLPEASPAPQPELAFKRAAAGA